MSRADQRWLTDSIASATTGANYLAVRQTSIKQPMTALVQVYGAGAAGVFTGSVQLEVSPPDANTWSLVGSAFTTAGSTTITIPGPADYRFNATALSANGPIVCFMELSA